MQKAVLLVTVLVAVASAVVVPQVAMSIYGTEIISFTNPSLSYISNLRYDPADAAQKNPRIFFTADKGSPNLFTAQFVPGGASPCPS